MTEAQSTAILQAILELSQNFVRLEKGQQEIVEQIDCLEQGQQRLEQGQKELSERMNRLEQDQEKIIERLDKIAAGVKVVAYDLFETKADVEQLKKAQ